MPTQKCNPRLNHADLEGLAVPDADLSLIKIESGKLRRANFGSALDLWTRTIRACLGKRAREPIHRSRPLPIVSKNRSFNFKPRFSRNKATIASMTDNKFSFG